MELNSEKYINRIIELIKFNADIFIPARMIHLKNKIDDDIIMILDSIITDIKDQRKKPILSSKRDEFNTEKYRNKKARISEINHIISLITDKRSIFINKN